MSGDATTLPLRGTPAGAAPGADAAAGSRAGARRALARARSCGVRAAALALRADRRAEPVVVLLAADRPSLLSPTTHVGYFPRWMAGPLGGLLPGAHAQRHTLKYHVHGRDGA